MSTIINVVFIKNCVFSTQEGKSIEVTGVDDIVKVSYNFVISVFDKKLLVTKANAKYNWYFRVLKENIGRIRGRI